MPRMISIPRFLKFTQSTESRILFMPVQKIFQIVNVLKGRPIDKCVALSCSHACSWLAVPNEFNFFLQHYDVFLQVPGVFSIFWPRACTYCLAPNSCHLAYGITLFCSIACQSLTAIMNVCALCLCAFKMQLST